MRLVGEFFNRYQKLKLIDGELNEFLVDYFKEKFNFTLDRKNITRRGRTIYLNLPPLLKSELLINQIDLLEKIKNLNNNIIKIN